MSDRQPTSSKGVSITCLYMYLKNTYNIIGI